MTANAFGVVIPTVIVAMRQVNAVLSRNTR